MVPTWLSGAGVWIWEHEHCLGGDIDKVAAALQAVGVSTILLKSDDGGAWYTQRALNTSGELVPVAWWWLCFQYQSRGFKVLAWGYHTGGDPGQQYFANGREYESTLGYVAEAAIAVETITYRPPEEPRYTGPDGYVIDAEDEIAGRVQQATYLCQQLRAAAPQPFPLGYAPISTVAYHVADPYRQFDDGLDFCLPQCYDTMFVEPGGWSVGQYASAAAKYGLNLPFFPAYCDVYPGFEMSDADVSGLLAAPTNSAAHFFSVWSLQHLSMQGMARLALIAQSVTPVPAPTPAPVPPPPPTPDPVQQKLDGLLNAVDQAESVLQQTVRDLTAAVGEAQS